MKFQQAIASVIFSVICTAPTFGMKETTLPHIPPELCKIIDEFSGKNLCYKQTNHLKPHSCLLCLATTDLTLFEEGSRPYNLLRHTTPLLAFSKVFKSLASRQAPLKSNLLLSSAIAITYSAIKSLCFSHHIDTTPDLTIKCPTNIQIDDYSKQFNVQGKSVVKRHFCKGQAFQLQRIHHYRSGYLIEYRQSSNMKLRKQQIPTPSSPLFLNLNRAKTKMGKDTPVDGSIIELEDGKVVFYLPDDDCRSEYASLPTTEKVTAFDFSYGGRIEDGYIDGRIIITGGKDGIRKWELQERENLDTIIKSMSKTTDADSD